MITEEKIKIYNDKMFSVVPSNYTGDYWLTGINPKSKLGEKSPHAGKWCIFGTKASIDKVWLKIKDIIEKDGVMSAKVRTGLENPFYPSSYSKKSVICVYVKDYRQEEVVFRVRDLIREIGVKSIIKFKTDENTAKRIYGTKDEFLYIHKLEKPSK